MLPLPRQPPGLRGPQSAAKEAGKSPALPKMATQPREGSRTATKSRPFLPFPFFHTDSELPPTLVFFSWFRESRSGEKWVACRDWGKAPKGEAGLPRPTGSDATVAVAARWNGRWVQVPAWPRPGCGTDSLGERPKRLPRVWRPQGGFWNPSPSPWPGVVPCTKPSSPLPSRAGQLASRPQLLEPCLQT